MDHKINSKCPRYTPNVISRHVVKKFLRWSPFFRSFRWFPHPPPPPPPPLRSHSTPFVRRRFYPRPLRSRNHPCAFSSRSFPLRLRYRTVPCRVR